MPLHDDAHWIRYNARQGGRPVRPLCLAAMRLRPPGTAIDLGCGAGRETRALLDAGWRVHAVDGSPETRAVVLRTIGGVHSRLTLEVSSYSAAMEIVSWDEEDDEGPAFSGPKHWHVHHIVARRRAPS
jgi:hypothetical protein